MAQVEDKQAIQSLAEIITNMGNASPHDVSTAIICWLPTAGYLKHEKMRNGRWHKVPAKFRIAPIEEKLRTSEWVRRPTDQRLIDLLMYHDGMNAARTVTAIIVALVNPEMTAKDIFTALDAEKSA